MRDIIAPELVGDHDYHTLVIGWGSTYGAIKEALDNLKNDKISFLYFKQVYPLHPSTMKNLLKKLKRP